MKQFDVLLGVKALVMAALPGADVRGFDEDTTEPETIGAGGAVMGYPGDPGDPDVDMSPLAYNYDHEFPLEIAAIDEAGGLSLVEMIEALGAAVEADRFLGGLCSYLDITAPQFRDRSTERATPNWADVSIIASYATSNPAR